ncbi:AraC family transcriptional regulator [Corynebacterium comes]|uniref:AraC family transcriptional regulator n=1 Tax=Corynebacterium comes TaxID=2675218 RepID=UPI0018CE9AA8|nr:AraC family transcriptional regulator [Corynebacterium comes]
MTFDDADAFGRSITRVYRPVFHDDAGRQATVSPVHLPGGGGFRAALQSYQLDDVVLSTVHASGHEVDYAGTVAPDDSALKIYYVLDGAAVIRQEGREQTIGRGQLGVHDSMNPYQVWSDTGFESLIMVVPKSRLLTLGPAYHDLRAARFTPDEGPGRVALPYLRGLAHSIDEVGRGYGHQIARTTVDMLTMLFGSTLGAAPPEAESRRAGQRAAIERWIDGNLLAEDLSPGRIAREHFISTRTLHNLFAEVGTTSGAVVRERRLALAGDLLIRHPELAVVQVAQRAGFPDASYFSRCFRRQFECTPSEFREAGWVAGLRCGPDHLALQS